MQTKNTHGRDSTIARWYGMYKDFHNFHWFGFVYIVTNTAMCSYLSYFVLSCYRAFMLSGYTYL